MENPWGTSHEPDPWAAPTSSSIATSSPGFGTHDDAEVDISAHNSHNDDWEPPRWNKDETYTDDSIYAGSSGRGFDGGFGTGGSGIWGSAAGEDNGGWGADTYAGIDLGGTSSTPVNDDIGLDAATGPRDVDEDIGGAKTPTPTTATRAFTLDNPFASSSNPFETSSTADKDQDTETTFSTTFPVFDDPSPFAQPDSPGAVDLNLNTTHDQTTAEDQLYAPDTQEQDEDGFGVFAHIRSPSFPSDHDSSWPSATLPPPPSDDSPWGQDTWSSSAGARNDAAEEEVEDEWTAAQRAQQARDARVPPEVRAALVAKAKEVVLAIWPLSPTKSATSSIGTDENSDSDVDTDNKDDQSKKEDEQEADNKDDQSKEDEQETDMEPSEPPNLQDMPRSLEDIPRINTLRMRLVPYDPPVPLTIIHFPQTHTSKALANTLRHTRNLPIIRHSPLAHFLASASRGSASWEASVRAPRPFSSSTDPHHDPEHEAAVPAGWRILEKKDQDTPTKQPERKSGFLANWLGRRTSSVPNEATRTPSPGIIADAAMKSPPLVASTSNPRTSISARMSIDSGAKPPTPVSAAIASTGTSNPSRTSTPAPTYSNGPDFFTPEDLLPAPDPTQQQPASAVSRFLGRFRQAPQKKDALANMSTDDLDILGEITPASSSGPAGFSPLSSGAVGPGMRFDGLDAMIRSEKIMTGPLPPVLAPPPRAGSTSTPTSRGATPVVSPVSTDTAPSGFGGLADLASFDSVGGLEKSGGGMVVPLPTRKMTAKPGSTTIKIAPIPVRPPTNSNTAPTSTVTAKAAPISDDFGDFGFGAPAVSGAMATSGSMDDEFGDFGDFGITSVHSSNAATDAFEDFASTLPPTNARTHGSKASFDLSGFKDMSAPTRLPKPASSAETKISSPSSYSGTSITSPAFPAFNRFADSSGINLFPTSDSRNSAAVDKSSSSLASLDGFVPSSSRPIGMGVRAPGLDTGYVGMGSTNETDSPILRSPSPPRVPAKIIAPPVPSRQIPGLAPVPGRLTPALAPTPATASVLAPPQAASPPPVTQSIPLASTDDDDFWGSMSAAAAPVPIQPPPSIAPPTISKPPVVSSPPLPSIPAYRGLGASELPSAPQDDDASGLFARLPGAALRSPPLPPITSLYGEYFNGSPTKSPPRKSASQSTRPVAPSELDITRTTTPPARAQVPAPTIRPPSASSPSTQAVAPKIQLLPLSAASIRNSSAPVLNNNTHRRTDSEVNHAATASLVATAAARQGTWPAPLMTGPSSGPAPTAPALAPPPGFRAPRTREAKDTDTAWGFDDDDDDDDNVPLGQRAMSPPRSSVNANGLSGAARVMSPPLPPQPNFAIRPPPGSQLPKLAPTPAAGDLFDFGSDSFSAPAPLSSSSKAGQALSQGQNLTASDLSFFDNL